MSKSEQMIEYALNFIGSRYQWGAEGPYNVGFDCSGFMLELLRAFGLWGKDDATAQNIYDKFKVPMNSGHLPGRLVFFGKSVKEITHIGLTINDFQYIEAGGGDSKSVDKGMIRIRPLAWRKDLVAFANPFKE